MDNDYQIMRELTREDCRELEWLQSHHGELIHKNKEDVLFIQKEARRRAEIEIKRRIILRYPPDVVIEDGQLYPASDIGVKECQHLVKFRDKIPKTKVKVRR